MRKRKQQARLTPQKPSNVQMTEQEVKTLWIYEHANRIGVKIYQPEGNEYDRARTNEAVLSD